MPADAPDRREISFVEIVHSSPADSSAAAAARATNLPLACIARTVLVRAGERVVALVHSGDTSLDMEAVSCELGAPARILSAQEAETVAGVPARALSPLGLREGFEAIYDERLLRLPSVCFPTSDETRSARVETRELRRLGARRARLARSPEGASGRSAYDVLLERGFVDRVTDEPLARRLLADTSVAAYVGFDPSASSLHVGSLMPIMALAHVQRCGLRAIALVGGATGLVGDPSGKTEMRKMLSPEDVRANMQGVSGQLARYLELDGRRGKLVDNASWFAPLGCLEFLRELGPRFSVNQMLKSESLRARMEREGEGLTYLELTYMLLQAYDFVRLAEEERCLVQMGGSDQWGNICAGIELGRRATGGTLFGRPVERSDGLAGVTFTLLTKASGGKFGKTESGNVWLDESRTSAYEFLQFWRNTDDADVERFLALFTFIPLEEIRGLCGRGSGRELNLAKEVLAFAATSLAHGKAKAVSAVSSARRLFGGYDASFVEASVRLGLASEEELASPEGGPSADGPVCRQVRAGELAAGTYTVVAALVELGLAGSKSESRRLIEQGGVQLEGRRVDSVAATIRAARAGERIAIRVGKKKYGILEVVE